MSNIPSLVCFLGFVLTGLALVWSQKAGQAARKRPLCVTLFLGYCLGASFSAGLTQHDLWPFSHWAVGSGRVPLEISASRLVAVDSAGIERAIDHRAWQPFPFDELYAWFGVHFPKLDKAAQDRVGRYLLHLVETSRARAQSGMGVGYLDRWLGPCTAPFFHLRPALWSRPGGLPPAPFVGLRVYEEKWHWRERMHAPEAFTRNLIYEYSQL